ncbi:hypothetical protein AVEN_87705-1 [Araneus ventricosus]|uniref:Uncharacterized protein n=1 Tax=Araneus ventricosus TaxID=182803 RepID=A0A4Y2TEC3_ARAVE|nr:hypothetical protein AVEN_87705-1 [Araneus ventricosus]
MDELRYNFSKRRFTKRNMCPYIEQRLNNLKAGRGGLAVVSSGFGAGGSSLEEPDSTERSPQAGASAYMQDVGWPASFRCGKLERIASSKCSPHYRTIVQKS